MNHLKELLEKHQTNIDIAARDEFRQLDTLLQEDAHTLAVAILNVWYDALVESYAKDFLQDLDPDYTEDNAEQSLHELLDNAVTYTSACQQILLCSPNSDAYLEWGADVDFKYEAAAHYALEADILEQLERVHSFDWTTGDHI